MTNMEFNYVAQKEIHPEPGLENKKDYLTRRNAFYEFTDEIRAVPISDDEFSHFSFPTIGFCDINSKAEVASSKPAQISDLCKEDRQRIAQLVTEISRCREDQKDKSQQAKKLFDENLELKSHIRQLEKDLSALRVSVKYGEDNLRLITKSHLVKEASFKHQNLELHNKIKLIEQEKGELQTKLEEAQKQAEKLANVVYYVSNENKKFYKKYDNSKERLKVALEAISQLELKQKEAASGKIMENKSSQTNLDFIHRSRSGLKCTRKEYRCHKKCHLWKQEQDERFSSDEDSLISELFFIPKQKNHTKPSYFSDDESP
ncbi:tropomyosin alpha-1 chain isoform X2 [Halyomorpha halys]|uniref:tropomyosin alpha-1 chain isoform X2 n=1 Tax=Halyomorpha halys TaxID=286706 RepID=UPI0034D249CC